MTKTAQHSLLFRIWIHIRGLLAFMIVLFGVIVGIISLILPNEDLYKQTVVSFLSKQLNKTVEIDHISGKWKGLGPKFIIQGLTIKDKDEVFIQTATLNINVIKYIIPKGSTGINLGINDIEVDLERNSRGKIELTDSSIKKESASDKLDQLLNVGNLSVNNITLKLFDSITQKEKRIKSKVVIQQSTKSRAFSMELDSKEIADKISLKAITNNSDDFLKKAKWYAEIKNLSLENLGKFINKSYLPIAYADTQLWFSTEKGNLTEMLGKAKLGNKLFNNDAQITGSAELIYKGNKHKWNAELSIKNIKTESIVQDKIMIYLSRNGSRITIRADILDIPLLKALTQILNISDDEFNDFQLKGKLKNVSIDYDVNYRRIIDANIEFSELKLNAFFGQITNLAGEVSLHDEQIRLLIDSENGSAHLPNYIRGDVNWKNLLLTAQTSMQDEDFDLKINSLWCDCNDLILDGAARIDYDDSLFIDLSVAVYNAEVNQLYKYWPSVIWKPKVLNFLDQALVKGKVDKGMIIYHGNPKKYPFENKNGVFLTKSNLIDATINYHKDWPMVTNFNAVVDTINRKIIVASQKGKVIKGKVDNVIARINDLKNPLLNVTIFAHGKDNFLVDILNDSPMKKGLKVLNEDLQLTGSQKINVNLHLPLNKPNSIAIPVGTIKFKDTNFQLSHFQLDKLNGNLNFEGASLDLNQLHAEFLGSTVMLLGNITNEPNKPAIIDASFNGNYRVENFEQLLETSIPAKGISQWKFLLSNINTPSQQIDFIAQSQLKGTEIILPAPLNKTKNIAIPFEINCTLPCLNTGWNLSYGTILKSNFSLNTLSKDLEIKSVIFGKQDDLSASFGGNIDTLDVDQWIEIITENHKKETQNKSLPFKTINLSVKNLIFMSRILTNVDLTIENINNDLVFSLDAESINGTIKVPKDLKQKGIIVKLDKLHWAKQLNEITTKITTPTSNYPPLHVWIGDFIYDGIPLGETSIEMRPIYEGVLVEKFLSNSDLLKLNINGIWQRALGKNGTSDFNIIMTSKDIAKFIKKIGFQAPISEANTLIKMKVQWPGFPSKFEIKNTSGSLEINIGEGEVVDTKPGMGRVLGLFSLTNLPRRLILDFKDVFSKGLKFEYMKGNFNLKNGDAITDAFVIETSSAQIVVKGKTGLDKQDYDQIVIVTPRVGRILPTIGAITGGAVGAAAGFLVQGMFHRGLKNVGRIIYKVTGSWEKPKIELIETQKRNEI